MHNEVHEVAEKCLGSPQLPTTQWASYILFILARKTGKKDLLDRRNHLTIHHEQESTFAISREINIFITQQLRINRLN
jgi:hypothetical protein